MQPSNQGRIQERTELQGSEKRIQMRLAQTLCIRYPRGEKGSSRWLGSSIKHQPVGKHRTDGQPPSHIGQDSKMPSVDESEVAQGC